MKVDPHCPIDVMGYEILHDDRGNARAYIKLRNISKGAASRLSAAVIWYGEGGESFSTSLEACELVARPGEQFTLTASTDHPKYPNSIDVLFSQVTFEQGVPPWRASAESIIITPPQPLAQGEEKQMLAYYAGEDALAFPLSDERVWMCVCLKANTLGQKRCSRCQRSQSEVLSEYTKQAIMKRPKPKSAPINVTLPISGRGGEADAPIKLMRRQRALLIRRSITMLSLALILAIAAFVVTRG